MLYVPDYLPFDSAADSEENLTSCDDSDYSSLDSDVEDISDTETIIPDGINYSSINGQSNASTSTKPQNSHNTVPINTFLLLHRHIPAVSFLCPYSLKLLGFSLGWQ